MAINFAKKQGTTEEHKLNCSQLMQRAKGTICPTEFCRTFVKTLYSITLHYYIVLNIDYSRAKILAENYGCNIPR